MKPFITLPNLKFTSKNTNPIRESTNKLANTKFVNARVLQINTANGKEEKLLSVRKVKLDNSDSTGFQGTKRMVLNQTV